MNDDRKKPAENITPGPAGAGPPEGTASSDSEEKFREIFDKINDAIHIHEIRDDGSPGRFIEVNEVACQRLQYTKEELLCLTPLDLTTDYHSHPLPEILNELATAGNALFETEHRRKDGVVIPVEVNAHVIRFGGKRRVLSVVRDITGRKLAEKALRESENKYKQLVTMLNEGIFTIDRDATITFANTTLARMLGFTLDEIVGTPVFSFLPPGARDRAKHEIESERSGEVMQREVTLLKKDGSQISVLMVTTPVLDAQGVPIGGIAAVIDITERKQMERVVLASLREKEILLKEIHHRVKNNLQIIASLLSLQSRYVTDENVLNVLKESQNRVKAMALVHERLYRSENLSEVALSDYLRFLIDNLFRFYGANAQVIRLSFDAGDVNADINTAIPIGLIINELVSNSLKHAFPEGRRGELAITLRQDERSLILAVHDNGPGIPADFDWRNAKSLGLRLVISLVDQLDGVIELDRFHGTTFQIIIPKRPGQCGNRETPF
jgi:PAS domain S-box-containing protein